MASSVAAARRSPAISPIASRQPSPFPGAPKPLPVRRTHGASLSLSPSTPRRLLIPTTRAWPPPDCTPRGTPMNDGDNFWFGSLRNFQIESIEPGVELTGFRIFAVEKWLVDRDKAIGAVVVYTGNSDDKIQVLVLSPNPDLPEAEARESFDTAVLELRKDGAKPKETENGVIMVTSLANFRSDLNIVPIPGGDFLAVRNELFVNINLLRMGCSGRSGLNLDPPSSSSKEKFMQLFSLAEPSTSFASPTTTGNDPWFKSAVLELVFTVQSALSLFGRFSLSSSLRDGLLCDKTVEGMQMWALEIGGYYGLEPMERVLEPSAVALLFSIVFTLRNKLSALGVSNLSKDPFREPLCFLHAMADFQRIPMPSPLQRPSYTPDNQVYFIDHESIERVNFAYAKLRQAEPYKVHRVLKNKIDDLTTVSSSLANNLNLSLRSTTDPMPVGSSAASVYSANLARNDHAGAADEATTDLDIMVKFVLNGSKHEIPATLRDLWGGRPGRHRQELEARHRSSRGGSRDLTADDEEGGIAAALWRGTGGKVQKKGQAFAHGIAEWTGLDIGKSKKTTGDTTQGESDTSANRTKAQLAQPPSLTLNGDKSPDATDLDDPSIHVHSLASSHRSHLSPASSVTNLNLSEYEKGMRRFNGRAGPMDIAFLRRIGTTVSDPALVTVSRLRDAEAESKKSPLSWKSNGKMSTTFAAIGESILDASAHDDPKISPRGYGRRQQEAARNGFRDEMQGLPNALEDEEMMDDVFGDERALVGNISRRRSIGTVIEWSHLPRQEVNNLCIDVELCSQLLNLKEKQIDMENATRLLRVIVESLGQATSDLHGALAPQVEALPVIESRRTYLTNLTRQGRSEADRLHGQAKTSHYQVERLEERTERLDSTLEGYTKRMDDVERAVEGIYMITPFADYSDDPRAEDEGSPTESVNAMVDQASQVPAEKDLEPQVSPQTSSTQDAREAIIQAAKARTVVKDPREDLDKANLEEKKAFRRIIIAQIERHNDERVAIESSKVLLKLANNILQNPDEPKYHQFKVTNSTIQRNLVEPKGALEYAVAMGFRVRVRNFQQIYVFDPTPKTLQSLRNGADCLNEVLQHHNDAVDQARRAKETEKAAQARRQELVRLAYEDDRKEKKARDEMEKQRREAVAARTAREALEAVESAGGDTDKPPHMPGLLA
ncbi:uncharacterized protein EI90DRAFT_3150540 [Cantharellus anzutake]|uniref:uncharacterized protein n=1 Tax=Cantharellus anzutake TaxID=1750568 RepID=UPI00190407AF|nr:uncharacterized protein EI90DRAFT_3150540 [Cantharellus anzutake]KAF8341410.1 hypothetical protein EI90DRAFT_3150540 [Cantharellus anzutake]